MDVSEDGGGEESAVVDGTIGGAAACGAAAVAPRAAAIPLASPAVVRAQAPVVPLAAMPAEVHEDEAVFRFEDRRYRVRGFVKATTQAMRVNILVNRDDLAVDAASPIAGFHIESFDVYVDRARAAFERKAALEIGTKEETVRRDVGRILLALEELATAATKKALEPKAQPYQMTDVERADALDLLTAPDLVDRIPTDLDRCGLVGEATNKLTLLLAAVSRKLERPLAVVIQSSSAAGKSALMDAILELLPDEEREKYVAMSGQALFYFDDGKSFRHKVLAIAEEEGAERATYALKMLQSEGVLTIASTGKDGKTGRLVTKEYRVEGPVMIILTTTAIEIDEELLNRCIVLTVDESREQTRRILEAQRERRTLEGLWARRDKAGIVQVHSNAQRLLRPLAVLNPYASRLTFLDDKTRMRRDHEKYLTLIDAIALLHQYQRPVKSDTRAGETIEYVEVEPKDIELANRLANEVLGRTLDELPPQTRRFLELLHQKVRAECEAQKIEPAECWFTRRQVREWTGWSDTQVRLHIDRLAELEYVLVHRGARGKSYVYELLYDGEGEDGRAFLMGLIDPDDLDRHTTSRGSDGGFAGSSRPQRGVIAGSSRGAETGAKATPERDSGDSRPKDAEKSPLGAAVCKMPVAVADGRRQDGEDPEPEPALAPCAPDDE